MTRYLPDYDRFTIEATDLVRKIAASLATPVAMKPPKTPTVPKPPSMKPVSPPQPKANFAPKFNPNTGVTKGTSPFTVAAPSK